MSMMNHRRLRCNYLTVLMMVFIFHSANANPDAKRLYDDLMYSYNRLIRPVSNNSDTLTVKMGLKLSQLMEVVSFTCFLLYICEQAVAIAKAIQQWLKMHEFLSVSEVVNPSQVQHTCSIIAFIFYLTFYLTR